MAVWGPGEARFPGLYCPGLIEAPEPPTPSCRRRRRFRGSIAPASLKRVGCILALCLEEAGFRGSIAPASLKRSGRPTEISIRHGFRGSIAPASLKRVGLGILQDPRKRRFPGLYCPGLIEAHAQRRRAARLPAGFRGSIAPASLKRRFRLGVPSCFPCFRGSIAPASLKPNPPPMPHIADTRFPGLYCPGLIEALRARAPSPPPPPAVSGALLPRPH